ncbi:MAG TPA: hypothetical protein VL244_08945 [Alphaproteobacteria bacterium]|nr:hypothetical protein [Alphaproteobacteria bacterium]
MAIFLWPLAFAAAGPAGLVLLWSISFDAAFMFAFPFLGLWALIAFLALLAAVILALGRLWLGALSLALCPLAVLVALLNFMSVWGFAVETGEYIHFRVKRAAYLADIARLPTDKGPRLAIFDWGGFVGSHAVVYDESDEVILSKDERSAAWKERIEGTELVCGIVAAEPLGDHFYITRIGC